MKKTLVALAVTAIATSASASTIYQQDGTSVDFYGSLRLRLDQEKVKLTGAPLQADTVKDLKLKDKRAHSNLHNNGSRFGVKVKHEIADDFYALGRVEFRFNSAGSVKNTDGFGDLYAHRAYIGLGSKQLGEVTFGRQATIGDDIAQAGFDNYYGTFDGTLPDFGYSVVRYDYKGIEGLQVGADYRFAEKRDENNEVTKDELKAGYGVGAVYTFPVVDGQYLTVAAGYSRDNLKSDTSVKHHKDAYQASTKYSINDGLTLALDYSGYFEKNGSAKERFNGGRIGAKYEVTPAVAVYTTYGHGVAKAKEGSETTRKVVFDKFMLGSEYNVHKNVFTYVEAGFGKTKIDEANKQSKSKERNIAVGLNVSW